MDSTGSPYHLLRAGDTLHAGLTELTRDIDAPPAWLSYLQVADLDGTHAAALIAGADELHGPTPIPGVGRFSMLHDPTGALVAFLESAA